VLVAVVAGNPLCAGVEFLLDLPHLRL
jgi:hypothetical protein